ncbi:7739_t:CDS:2 [Ambispora gerdemannii]|uniref:7739_t:CDS:1 n=1 Tax=Ambispora gerdemannii TaxID=144530 RepID=A0A9N9AMX1_9GLOM|nr:7739_t:CDS:2 [Ambispora gerdemannii]
MVNTGKPTSSKKKAASSNLAGNSGSSSKNGAAPIKIRIPPPKKQTTSSTTPSLSLASSSTNTSTALSVNAKSKASAPPGPSSAVSHVAGENVKHETEESEEETAEPPREEHFILRISGLPQESQEKFREQARKRHVFDDLSILFKDPRHAIFSYDKEKYSARLVDLPCIIESQKTLNNKQFYKIADISQMLVVESSISNESELNTNKASMQWDEFLWQDGLSPPLKSVRKRRFRKRFSNRNIEEIDNEVERLLTLAKAATSIRYELTEIEDSEVETPGPDGEDRIDGEFEGLEIGDEIDSDGEEAGAALQRELEMMDVEDERAVASDNEPEEEEEEEDDESDEDSDESSESEEETEEDLEQKRKELEDQIATNESAIQGKHNQLANTVNTIIKKRFEETIEKLTADIELKKIQLDEVKRKLEAKRASTVTPI